jgi:hypothetical protein
MEGVLVNCCGVAVSSGSARRALGHRRDTGSAGGTPGGAYDLSSAVATAQANDLGVGVVTHLWTYMLLGVVGFILVGGKL